VEAIQYEGDLVNVLSLLSCLVPLG